MWRSVTRRDRNPIPWVHVQPILFRFEQAYELVMSTCELPTIAQARADRLEARVHELAGILNRAHAQLVAAVAEAIEHEAWGGGGIVSPNHWLVLHAGLSRGRADSILGVARRRAELPATIAAFDAGHLSLEQTAVVARYTPTAYDASVAELAVNATVPQIYRAVSRYSFDEPAANDEPATGSVEPAAPTAVADTEADTEAAAERMGELAPTAATSPAADPDPATDPAPRPAAAPASASAAAPTSTSLPDPDPGPQLSMGYDANGRFVLRFTAPADVGALIEAALKEAKDALFTAGTSGVAAATKAAGTMGFTCSYGQVFTQILTGHLHAATAATASRRELYRVLVHLDAGGAWLNGRPPLPRHLVEKLTCDGSVSPLWERDGIPVRLGRTRRIVPPKVRALILDRDRGCRYPGCPASGRSHLDIHHIQHWLNNGLSDPENLIAVCPFHHDAHHGGLYQIHGNPELPDNHPDGLRFTTDRGLPITAAPPPGREAGPPETTPVYSGPTGETLHLRWVDFHPAS